MMEELTENNFIFSLTLKSKTLTESGCLPDRHGAAGSFKWTENKKNRTPKEHKGHNTNLTIPAWLPFRINYAPQFHHSHLKFAEEPEREGKKKTNPFFLHVSSRVKALWEAKNSAEELSSKTIPDRVLFCWVGLWHHRTLPKAVVKERNNTAKSSFPKQKSKYYTEVVTAPCNDSNNTSSVWEKMPRKPNLQSIFPRITLTDWGMFRHY